MLCQPPPVFRPLQHHGQASDERVSEPWSVAEDRVRRVMGRFLRHGPRLAALGAAAGAGWWVGSARPREADGGLLGSSSPPSLPDGLFSVVFGKVSAATLQGYAQQAPAEVPQLEPGAPRVAQVREAARL